MNDTMNDAFTHPAIKHELATLREQVRQLEAALRESNAVCVKVARLGDKEADTLRRERDELLQRALKAEAALAEAQRVVAPATVTNAVTQKIDAACAHPGVTYYPDPSGNNDGWYECDSCKADVTKIARKRLAEAGQDYPRCGVHSFVTVDKCGCLDQQRVEP